MNASARLQARVVSAVAAALLAVVLPLQTYFGNAAAFPFSFGRLLPELLGLFVLFYAGVRILGRLLDLAARALRVKSEPAALLYSFLTGLLVCVCLETGVLSAGLPELNGGAVAELAETTRGWIDAAVWGAVLAASVLFVRRLKPYLGWIALAVLALALAALVDAAADGRGKGASAAPSVAEGGGTFATQPTVVANVRYSAGRNILVFVLDSMPGLLTADVVRTNAALSAKFPGFTAFPQNVGMHECTKRGVPGLVTGRHYDPAEMSEVDYPMTMYGTNSFVTAAEAAAWSVAFSPDLLPYGRTNLPIERRVAPAAERRSRDALAFLRQSTEVPHLSLFDLVAFRVVPFAAKGPVLYGRIRHAVKGRHGCEAFWNERQMYPMLAARPADGTRPFLGFFHSFGVHPPWTAGLAAEITDKMARLGELLAVYRESGLYDRSLIIVVSDHGLEGVTSVGGFPPSASALLWVKPEGAAGPLAFSDAATSHAGVAPLVKAALARPLAAEDCRGILVSARRLFRAERREGFGAHFRDWEDTEKEKGK